MNSVAIESATTAMRGTAAGAAQPNHHTKTRFTATQCLLAVLVMVSVGVLLYPLQQRHPIQQVKVMGDLTYLDREQLMSVINRHLAGSWLMLAADDIRQSVLALPWVKQGSVRLVWPDKLEIEVSERQVVARWGEEALLDTNGELFTPGNLERFSSWPRFDGPVGTQQRLLAAWQRLNIAFEVFQITLHKLRLLDRGEWFITTDRGVLLITDSTDPASVVITYGDALANTFGVDLAEVSRIDFRYTNGFAVTSKENASGT